MGTLRFDGKTVIVTGAGNGLGRAHALLFGSRGANVVVNDLGGSMHGGGKSSAAADEVVEQIKAAGGNAVANYDSVEDGASIVKTAMDAFGRVDVLVNNAGILRDKSFAKMTEEDWELVYRVHVLGAFRVTHAVWPIMREQQYGRIVMTASAAGLYGNFGQANYAMAKLGLAGFSNTLAIEGRTKNVHVNTIAPIAGSRLTETVMPQELVDALKPEYVSPLVAYLCHEDTEETGGIFEVGGGFFGKLRWERSVGSMTRLGREITPEIVASHWDSIAGFDETTHPADVMGSMQPIVENVSAGPSRGGNEFIDVDAALGAELPPVKTKYDERDLALYALGVGAAQDPSGADLPLVYELHNEGFKALPTYAVVPAVNAFLNAMKDGLSVPGLNYGLDRVLHGEQRTTLIRPLPKNATLTHKARVKNIFDKGKHGIVEIETKTYDEDDDLLCINEIVIVVRGAGGWGGERGESTEAKPMPETKPDAVAEEKTHDNQALLYRLSGDWNPLHADPQFAKMFGFDKPILHGLCTLGFAGRHVVQAFANNDPRYVKRIGVRFADSVFPGETLVTEMWKQDGAIRFVTKAKERDSVVLKDGVIELFDEIPKKAPKSKTVELPVSDEGATAVPTSADVFTAIRRYIEANPSLAKNVQTVFRFELSNPGSAWTIDLKKGEVHAGRDGDADTTLALTDDDFMKMCTGEADAQKMFMSGQLKITGNVMASQKLEFLKKLDPAWVFEAAAERGGAGGAAPVASDEPTSWDVFVAIEDHVKRNPDLVAKIGMVYRFDLTDPDTTWTIDLKSGAVVEGAPASADCTLTLSDADFMAMTKGEADPQKLFMGGQLKISGNIMASQKLEFLQKMDPEEAKAAVIAARKAGRGPSASSGTSADAPAASQAEVIAKQIEAQLAKDHAGTVQILVTDPDAAMTVDASVVKLERAPDPAATVTVAQDDLLGLLNEEKSAQALFQRGELRIDGDLDVARRLWFIR